jgi:hypothetical protein
VVAAATVVVVVGDEVLVGEVAGAVVTAGGAVTAACDVLCTAELVRFVLVLLVLLVRLAGVLMLVLCRKTGAAEDRNEGNAVSSSSANSS